MVNEDANAKMIRELREEVETLRHMLAAGGMAGTAMISDSQMLELREKLAGEMTFLRLTVDTHGFRRFFRHSLVVIQIVCIVRIFRLLLFSSQLNSYHSVCYAWRGVSYILSCFVS